MKQDGRLENVPLLMSDFDAALEKIQPSVSPKDVTRHEKWNKEFAAV